MITIKSSHPDYNLPNCVWLRTLQLSPALSRRLSVPDLGLTANRPGTVTGVHTTAERLRVCCPRVPFEPGCPEERSPRNRRLSQPAAPSAEKPPPPRTIPHHHVRVRRTRSGPLSRRGGPGHRGLAAERRPALRPPAAAHQPPPPRQAASRGPVRSRRVPGAVRAPHSRQNPPPHPALKLPARTLHQPLPGSCPPPPVRDPAAAPRSPHSRRAPVAELVGDSLDAAGPRHGDIAALEAEVKAHHGHGPAAGGGPRPALARFAPGAAAAGLGTAGAAAPCAGGRGEDRGRRRRFKYDNETKFPETAATTHRLHVRLPLPPSAAFSNNSCQSAAPEPGDAGRSHGDGGRRRGGARRGGAGTLPEPAGKGRGQAGRGGAEAERGLRWGREAPVGGAGHRAGPWLLNGLW